MIRARIARWTIFATVVALSAAACGGNSEGTTGDEPGMPAGARGGSQGASGATGVIAGATASGDLPAGACANGKDDDGDGAIDGFDSECTGAADDDEGTFATGIPGDNRDPKWQDCFFDGNSGAGDDGCRYHTDCLYGKLESDNANCAVTRECLDYCRPLTPNGCDCFGCCTVQDASGRSLDIVLQPACSTANVDDAQACPRCEKSPECNNTCGRCELCPGRTAEDLPEDCAPQPPVNEPPPSEPPPSYTCDGGQVCGDSLPCDGSMYCQLGCCMPVVR